MLAFFGSLVVVTHSFILSGSDKVEVICALLKDVIVLVLVFISCVYIDSVVVSPVFVMVITHSLGHGTLYSNNEFKQSL